MNIFLFNTFDLQQNAQAHPDLLCTKMILESAQLIQNAIGKFGLTLTKNDGTNYGQTHLNHPCSKWVCESRPNLIFAINYFWSLIDEYEARYGKSSTFRQNLQYLQESFGNVVKYSLEHRPKDFAIAISDFWLMQFVDDKIISQSQLSFLLKNNKRTENAELAGLLYRTYLIYAKTSYAEWRYCDAPAFWTADQQQQLSKYQGRFSKLNYRP